MFTARSRSQLQFLSASALACLAAMPACTTTKKDVPREERGVFTVKAVPYFGKDVPVYLSARTRLDDGKRSDKLGSCTASSDGTASFLLPLGKLYDVTAYADIDKNGKQDATDPTATLKDLKPLSVQGSGPEYDPITLTMPGAGVDPALEKKLKGQTKLPAGLGARIGVSDEELQKGVDKVKDKVPGVQIPESLPVPPPPQ